jgi:hypothetical protein
MSTEDLNIIVETIDKNIVDVIDNNNLIISCYEVEIDPNYILDFAREIAKELFSIEEEFDYYYYILLSKNNVYIKIDWQTYPEQKLAIIYTQVCKSLNSID